MILGRPSVTATSTATRSAVIASRGVTVSSGRLFTFDIRILFVVLTTCPRREHAAIGLEVDQRRLVETVETAHQHRVAFKRDEADGRHADRIGTYRRAQREGAARLAIMVPRALLHEIAARTVEPVQHLEMSEGVDAVQRRHPGLEDFEPANRPLE